MFSDFVKRAAGHADPEVIFGTGAWILWRRHSGACIIVWRGIAAETIRNIILTDSKFIASFTPAIEALIADRTLFVRACAASILHAIAVHNVPLALHE